MTKRNAPFEKPSGFNVYLVEWWPEEIGYLSPERTHVVAPDISSALTTISSNPNDFKSVTNLGGAVLWEKP